MELRWACSVIAKTYFSEPYRFPAVGLNNPEKEVDDHENDHETGRLALALLGSATVFAGPALTNSLHDEGDFGGAGPSGGPECWDYQRKRNFHRFYGYGYGPAYSYDYYDGPAYDYGPRVWWWGPGVGVELRY